jgi:hypothetical protein
MVAGSECQAGCPDYLDDRQLRGDVKADDLGPFGWERCGNAIGSGYGAGEYFLGGSSRFSLGAAAVQSVMKVSTSSTTFRLGR